MMRLNIKKQWRDHTDSFLTTNIPLKQNKYSVQFHFHFIFLDTEENINLNLVKYLKFKIIPRTSNFQNIPKL